jgi:hypothetical protein
MLDQEAAGAIPHGSEPPEVTAMVIVRAKLGDIGGPGRSSMSVVLDSGEIHHFFALHDGVHHSWTARFKGDYDAALLYELRRPNAEIVNPELTNLWVVDGGISGDDPAVLAS